MSIVNKFKPISISLSPNVEKDDVNLALKMILQPWNWKSGNTIKKLENDFKEYLGVKYAFSFNSGRSSLSAILKVLKEVEGLKDGDDVLLQAFTCNAVPNPILWAKLNPVYIDCNKENFNIDLEDLKRKISPKTKVLIVQHTFGLPANMDELTSIAEQNNLILIEDCAHSLGAKWNGKKVGLPAEALAKVGTLGKLAFFSFSRDKVISCVYGGMAVTNDPSLALKLREAQDKFGMSSYFWILQQLLHPILLNFIILPIYNFLDLGKIFLILSQWTHVLSKAVSFKEKRGLRPDYFPKSLPNALSLVAMNQFNKLEKFNEHRQKIAEFYYNELSAFTKDFGETQKDTHFVLPKKENNIFLRFAVKHSDAHRIIYEAWRKENILLGDWYTTPIAPDDTKMKEMKYETGMCPNAENLSKITLNLPTHINISIDDAKRIVSFLKKFV